MSRQPMRARPIRFDLDIGVVLDIDPDPLAPRSTWLQSLSNWESVPLGSHEWISIQGNQRGQFLVIENQHFELPAEWKNPEFPHLRALPDGRILLVDTHPQSAQGPNAWIINRRGQVEERFDLGGAPVEIAAMHGGMLIVAYHPSSAARWGFKTEVYQRGGLAFFDLKGQLLNTFNHLAAHQGVQVDHIRCMTRLSPTEIMFVPETATWREEPVENPVILYSCNTGLIQVLQAPWPGAEACTAILNRNGDLWVLLASPEGFADQLVGFDPERKISQYLGAFAGVFRGLAPESALSLSYAGTFGGSFGGSLGSGLGRAGRIATQQPDPISNFDRWTNSAALNSPTSSLASGFLAQEFNAEYSWIEADPQALIRRELEVLTPELMSTPEPVS
jgi:hypothetical protein